MGVECSQRTSRVGKQVENLDNLVRPESEEVFKEGWKYQKDTEISFKGSYWPNINLRKKMTVMAYNTSE